ncbi:hypothetical protein C0J52_03328 [Blattella germanica]|nr:hypothetical protein C0J52_03328 [Blattella germanica]
MVCNSGVGYYKLRKSMECTVACNVFLSLVADGFKPSWQLGNKLSHGNINALPSNFVH